MRIAIFSDIHANLEALEAVLGAYAQERIDRFICLGDIVGYGADPDRCCDLIRQIAAATVIGNHDAAVAGRMDYSYYYEAARDVLDKHASELSDTNMEWLRGLPYEHREGDLSYCHGSPADLEAFDYVFTIEQAQELLPRYEQLGQITFIGHSHLCKAFDLSSRRVHEVFAKRIKFRRNHRYLVSVGSVGQPRDSNPWASYCLYDSEQMLFEFKRVEYNVEAAAQKIFNKKLERNFGNRLFLGV